MIIPSMLHGNEDIEDAILRHRCIQVHSTLSSKAAENGMNLVGVE
jgi:hypothetical protein